MKRYINQKLAIKRFLKYSPDRFKSIYSINNGQAILNNTTFVYFYEGNTNIPEHIPQSVDIPELIKRVYSDVTLYADLFNNYVKVNIPPLDVLYFDTSIDKNITYDLIESYAIKGSVIKTAVELLGGDVCDAYFKNKSKTGSFHTSYLLLFGRKGFAVCMPIFKR